MLLIILGLFCLIGTQPDNADLYSGLAASVQPASSTTELQRKLDEALLDAIEKGDRARITSLLAQGANVNAKGINDTALETALFHQEVEIALLLSKGAKIQTEDLADAARGSQGDKEKATALVNNSHFQWHS